MCPSIATAREIVARAPERNVTKNKVSKGVLIAGVKSCTKSRDLVSGRKLHAAAVESGHFADRYVACSLLDMYAKCGSMAEARQIFQRMERHSVIAWNTLIMGYADNAENELALELILPMQSEGLEPNAWTFVALLKACSNLASKQEPREVDGSFLKVEALKIIREIHSMARAGKNRCDTDIFVANSLVAGYSNCGSMVEARRVFDSMEARDVVSWNSIVLGYAENGEGETALELFVEMRSSCCAADSRTFVAAIKACTVLAVEENGVQDSGKTLKLKSLEIGMAVHSEAMRSGFLKDIFVASSLVSLYAKCGSMMDACSVFYGMDRRNVVSWTALIMGFADSGDCHSAFRLIVEMQKECAANCRTLVAAFKACSSLATKKTDDGSQVAALEKGMALHALARSVACERRTLVANSLIDMYAKCGSMVDSRTVFDRMAARDVISWNSLLLGYVDNGEPELALEVFRSMTCEPDCRTFMAALKACASLAAADDGTETAPKMKMLDLGMAMHAEAAKRRLDTDIFVANTLVDMYAKCRSMTDSSRVFERMSRHTVVSWTAVMLGYVESGDGEAALEIFFRMRSSPETTKCRDACIYVSALKACGSISALELGRAIHGEINRFGLERVESIVSSLVDLYGKCGSMIEAEQVFDSKASEDVVTLTALLTGYSRQGDTAKVLQRFYDMEDRGFRPVGITFLAVLTACSHAGLVEKGRAYFNLMQEKYGIEPSLDHYHCLVDLLGRANKLDSAVETIRTMPFAATAVTWTTLLAACRKWNDVGVAKAGFESMLSVDNEEQAAAYVLMRNIYGTKSG